MLQFKLMFVVMFNDNVDGYGLMLMLDVEVSILI